MAVAGNGGSATSRRLRRHSTMSLTILTVNIHKGFGFLNRRFVLPELRAAVRAVSADLVFLQEVLGAHELHALKVAEWPGTPHYEFLADTLWSDFAYGRN